MAGQLEYSSTAASNTAINGIGIAGSNTIKNGDDAVRQMMADTAASITKVVDKALGTYTAVKADYNQLWRATGAVTINLTAAATLTSGWCLWVKGDGGAVTVDPAGAELINGAATLTVADGSSALIVCTGSAFRAVYVPALPLVPSVDNATDFDTITTPGWSSRLLNGTNANGPAPAGYFAVLAISTASTPNITQIAFPYQTNSTNAYYRNRFSGVWTAWRKIPYADEVQPIDALLTAIAGLTTANGKFLAFTGVDTAAVRDIVGTVSQSGGIPTGAIVERGSNANGEYVRFADGTQICWWENIVATGTTITFPAAFASAPKIVSSRIGTSVSTVTHNAHTLTTTNFIATHNTGASSAYGWEATGRWF